MTELKKLTAIVLCAVMLTVELLSGCSVIYSNGADYCKRFIDKICSGDFEDAYEMIDVAIQKDDPEGSATATPMAIPTDTVEPVDDNRSEQELDDDTVIDGKVVETPEPTPTPTPTPTPPPTPPATS